MNKEEDYSVEGVSVNCLEAEEFYNKLVKKQKDCPPKYIELVSKHFWDLF